jgi:hypothetical protein
MKLNTLTIVLFGAATILLYAGIKDKSPKDVITFSLAGQSPSGASAATIAVTPVTPSVALHPAAKPPHGTASV